MQASHYLLTSHVDGSDAYTLCRGRGQKTRNHALADWPRGSQAMHVFSPQISLSWNALNRLHLMQQSAFNTYSECTLLPPLVSTHLDAPPEITVVYMSAA